MNYFYDLENGQHIEFWNEGDQTFVSFGSRSPGQQQSQARGFTTGKWSKEPSLFLHRDQLVLEIHTNEGSRFLRVDGNQVQQMDGDPDMSHAKQLQLEESSGEHRMKPMKPMEWMKPMEPMEPMMRPMEMKMGGMRMSMGATEEQPARKFCTQCGNALGPEDRFCANCGHKI